MHVNVWYSWNRKVQVRIDFSIKSLAIFDSLIFINYRNFYNFRKYSCEIYL